MFDLITGTKQRPLRQKMLGPKVLSIAAHVVVVTLLIVIPLLRVTNTMPAIPTMMAFVASVPPPPPPPPPPPAPAARPAEAKAAVHTATAPQNPLAAPIEAPAEIAPEVSRVATTGGQGGVEGGVEGGVAGGIVGGIPGGVVPPPPPPPSPAPVPRAPVHVGGQITAPALVKRVEPTYPELASSAQLTGIVILEATVGTDGCVESVKVLRSRHPFLDRASVDALKQWQYSPLMLNGIETPFVVTVTFNFSVTTR
jgi:periplasmic protein TonB